RDRGGVTGPGARRIAAVYGQRLDVHSWRRDEHLRPSYRDGGKVAGAVHAPDGDNAVVARWTGHPRRLRPVTHGSDYHDVGPLRILNGSLQRGGASEVADGH